MTTIITITEEQFDATYSLLPNHLNPHASWVIGDEPGCLFETYGEELDFVRSQDPLTVWTLLDGGDDLSLASGYHFVNRIGYLIATAPVSDGLSIEVSIPMDTEEV